MDISKEPNEYRSTCKLTGQHNSWSHYWRTMDNNVTLLLYYELEYISEHSMW